MQRNLGFFDSYKRDRPGRVFLKKSGQHPKSSQGSVGHCESWKAPRVLLILNSLPELERFFVSKAPHLDVHNARDDCCEQLYDALVLCFVFPESLDNTRDVASIPAEH